MKPNPKVPRLYVHFFSMGSAIWTTLYLVYPNGYGTDYFRDVDKTWEFVNETYDRLDWLEFVCNIE